MRSWVEGLSTSTPHAIKDCWEYNTTKRNKKDIKRFTGRLIDIPKSSSIEAAKVSLIPMYVPNVAVTMRKTKTLTANIKYTKMFLLIQNRLIDKAHPKESK